MKPPDRALQPAFVRFVAALVTFKSGETSQALALRYRWLSTTVGLINIAVGSADVFGSHSLRFLGVWLGLVGVAQVVMGAANVRKHRMLRNAASG